MNHILKSKCAMGKCFKEGGGETRPERKLLPITINLYLFPSLCNGEFGDVLQEQVSVETNMSNLHLNRFDYLG